MSNHFLVVVTIHRNIDYIYYLALKQQRHGAEEAHRAHNPGVVGSKPTAANFFLFLQTKEQPVHVIEKLYALI